MQGKILVPLDGSELAERAVRFAVSLATKSSQRVQLLHVHFPVPELWSKDIEPESYRWEFETREAADTYLEQARGRILEALRERVSAGVRQGDVADELVDEMGSDVTMVVMTTQGQTGLRGVLLGTIAQRVVHDAHIPVVLLGRHVKGWARATDVKVENILVALDGSASGDAVLEPAIRVATWYGSQIHLVGVVPGGVGFGYPSVPHGAVLEGGAAAEALAGHLAKRAMQVREAGVTASHSIRRNDHVADALVHAAEEIGADLIAMSTHARGPALRVLLGSVSEGVLKNSPVPVLMLRPRSD